MRAFRHVETQLRVSCGPDSLAQLGGKLDRLQVARAVIVCGRTLAAAGSPLDLVRGALGDRCAGVTAEARPHSPLPAVLAATEQLRRLNADAVVAVGGGSAIVTARAASILLAEGGDLDRIATSIDRDGRLASPKLLAPKLPQIVVPTTPTTAAVKAGSAIYDPAAGRRRALFDPKTRTQSVFIHPDLIRPVPRSVFISASLNTLAMAVEGLISRTGDPLADAALMQALRLTAAGLAPGALDRDDTARGELMIAALLCGRGTDHTGGGMTSALGHAIGARHEIENGVVNAIVLPLVLRFNAKVARGGLGKAAAALGLDDCGGDRLVPAIVAALARIFERLGIPGRLREAGVPREALPDLAALAMEDWFLRGNPRPIRDADELRAVLEDAW